MCTYLTLLILHLKMVKTVNFLLYVFYHNPQTPPEKEFLIYF